MCGGITYQKDDGQQVKIYFPNPKAALPVKTKAGDIEWIPWGRRREELGGFPAGGWARLESVKEGKWERYQPVPVLIIANAYMEKDTQRQSHWFDLEQNMAIQGLIAHVDNTLRVYVVTIATPEEFAHIHNRWPRLVNLPENNTHAAA